MRSTGAGSHSRFFIGRKVTVQIDCVDGQIKQNLLLLDTAQTKLAGQPCVVQLQHQITQPCTVTAQYPVRIELHNGQYGRIGSLNIGFEQREHVAWRE